MPEELQPIVQRIILKDDAAESAKTEAAISKVRADLRGLASDTASISAVSSSVGQAQVSAFGRTVPLVDSAQSSVEQLRRTYLNLADAERVAGDEAVKAGEKQKASSAAGGALASARQVAGVAGGVASTIGGGQAVSAVSSILGLTAALGPLGAAAGVGVVALNAVTQAEQQRAEAAKNTADLLIDIYTGAGDATTESLNAQIETLQAQRGQLEQAKQNLKESADQFGYVNLFGETVAVQPVIDQTQAAIDDLSMKLVALGAQANTEAVKANDAAAATEEFAKQLEDATAKTTQAQLAEAQRAVQIQQMTKEERDKEVASIAEEITVLENYINTHALTEESYSSLSAQLDQLRTRTDELTGTTLTYADVLAQVEAQQKAVSDQTDNYFDALKREGEIRDKIAAIRADIAQIEADAQTKIGEVYQESADKRIEIEDDAAERREEIAADSADAILRIQRDLGRSEKNARRERDVAAAIAAREKAQDDLDDQKKRDDKALGQVEKNLQKQEEAIRKGQEKQIAAIVAGTQSQLNTRITALNYETKVLEYVQLAQEQIALTSANGQIRIHTQMWQDVNAAAVTWAANTVNTVRSIFGLGSGGSGSGSAQATQTQLIDDRIRARFADIFA